MLATGATPPYWRPSCETTTKDLFKDLFWQDLDSLEILCFGLYGLLDPPNPSMKRFMITNLSNERPLLPQTRSSLRTLPPESPAPPDQVFCSVPFHQSHLLPQTRSSAPYPSTRVTCSPRPGLLLRTLPPESPAPPDQVFCSVPFHQSHLLTQKRAKTPSHRL
ncbi:uncharacterized protein [Salvelinus alpinus]|uniref:uncharacterized protein isoform X2 n=1 Tax=Salvelinus alpinus TaxID=8036 RepID=UPI0039FCF627